MNFFAKENTRLLVPRDASNITTKSILPFGQAVKYEWNRVNN